MSGTNKQDALIRDLLAKLTLRGYLHLSQPTQDSILISYNSTETAGNPNIIIRVQQHLVDTGLTNIVGVPQFVYNPMVAQILFEDSIITPGQTADGEAVYSDRVSFQQRLVVLAFELGRDGIHIEFWRGNGIATPGPITDASWATAVKIGDIGDLLNPLIGEV